MFPGEPPGRTPGRTPGGSRTRYVRFGYSSEKAQGVGGSRSRWIPESGKLGPGITGLVGKPVWEITGPVENRSAKWSIMICQMNELML